MARSLEFCRSFNVDPELNHTVRILESVIIQKCMPGVRAIIKLPKIGDALNVKLQFFHLGTGQKV